jgi:uncharacterized membrane protein YedE/YeeE
MSELSQTKLLVVIMTSLIASVIGYVFGWIGVIIVTLITVPALALYLFEDLRQKAKSLLVEYLEYMGKYPMW